MTEKFPDIKKNETVLVRAEMSTGYVLDVELEYAINSNQKVYTIFSTLEEAVKYAKLLVANNENVECNLYGIGEEFLMRIDHS